MLMRVFRATAAVALVGALAPVSLAVNASRVEYYHRDALGNVRVLTDENGQVLERHDYLPFGEECTTGACAANPGVADGQPLRFTGNERDQETARPAARTGPGAARRTSMNRHGIGSAPRPRRG